MSRRRKPSSFARLATCLCIAFACGSPAPPAGPEYEPVHSAESETRCPDERAAAHAKRERWLDDTSDELRASLSEAVLALAECETRVLEGATAPAGTADRILERIRDHREKVSGIVTLFSEVVGYGHPEFAGRANLRLGEMHLSFAAFVESIATPEGMEPAEAVTFRQELDESVATLRLRAVSAYRAASAPGMPVPLRRRACQALVELNVDDPSCRGL